MWQVIELLTGDVLSQWQTFSACKMEILVEMLIEQREMYCFQDVMA